MSFAAQFTWLKTVKAGSCAERLNEMNKTATSDLIYFILSNVRFLMNMKRYTELCFIRTALHIHSI